MVQDTKVVNLKLEAYDIYIGRVSGSSMHYGNIASHLAKSIAPIKVPTREASIVVFREWVTGRAYTKIEPERRAWIIAHLEELRGQTLGCFCKPKSCHGDTYVDLLEGRILILDNRL